MTRCIEWHLDPALGLRVPVIDLANAGDARQALASVATLESYALLQMLQREQAHDLAHGDDMFDLVFRATMQRLVALNSVTCSAVSSGPGVESPAEIANAMFGSEGWRDSRDPAQVAGGAA